MAGARERMLIGRTVAEHTAADNIAPSPDSQAQLLKLLRNPATVDLTYNILLERVGERPSETAVLRAVKLLKTHLAKHTPSEACLRRIDTWCQLLPPSTSTEAAVKSAQYVRAMVSKLLGSASSSGLSGGGGLGSGGMPSMTGSVPGVQPSPRGRHSGLGVSSTDDATDLVRRLPAALTGVCNALAYRAPLPSPRRSGGVPGPTLSSSVMFGGQFKLNSEGGMQGDTLRLADVLQVKERVRTVAVEKKREEGRQKGEGRDARRRMRPLFQYRYYRQQTPLTLSALESEAMKSAVSNPSAGDHESHLIASKILVKLLIDALSADEDKGIVLASATLLELLALPSSEAQLHAFNVLFNLTVHAHLLDETALLTEPDVPPRRGSVDAVQAALFRLCCDMLRALLTRGIEDERVWNAALNALLYFTTHNGRVVPRLMSMIDTRLILTFMRFLTPARDMLQQKLVVLLLAQLYPDGVLSSAAVKQAGGIEEIAAHYSLARTCSAADNLFVVLFDWALLQLPDSANKDTQAALLLRELHRIEAAQCLRAVFRCVPERLTESVVRHVLDPRIDRAFATAVIQQLEQLASHTLQLSIDHQTRLAAMSAGGADLAQHTQALDALLHSPVDTVRRSGELWLFALMRLASDGRRPPPPVVLNAVDTLQAKLLLSHDARVRRVYFNVTERLALHLRFKMQTPGDDYRLYAIFKLLNDSLSRLALPQFRERNEANLMQVVHTILDLIAFRCDTPHGAILSAVSSTDVAVMHGTLRGSNSNLSGSASATSSTSNLTVSLSTGAGIPMSTSSSSLAALASTPLPPIDVSDAYYDLFLRGRAGVSLSLLNELNVSILHALFVNVPASAFPSVRTVLLLLVIERCRTSEGLDAVGMAFFRGLLADRNPDIAYYASRFLLDELQAERPEQYTAMLNALLSKAQATNDEQLLANPYVQINEMIRGFASEEAAGRLSPPSIANTRRHSGAP